LFSYRLIALNRGYLWPLKATNVVSRSLKFEGCGQRNI
jgi:hypothetical protein